MIEGGRLQPNLPVFIFDPQGIPRDQTKTDDQGRFLFKEVVPGTYRVVATKSGSGSRGEAPVQVMEGQKKVDVEVKMTRLP